MTHVRVTIIAFFRRSWWWRWWCGWTGYLLSPLCRTIVDGTFISVGCFRRFIFDQQSVDFNFFCRCPTIVTCLQFWMFCFLQRCIWQGGAPSCVGKSKWILRLEGIAWKVTQFPSSGRQIMRCLPVNVSSSSRLHIPKSPACSQRSSSTIICIWVCGFNRERVVPSSGALNWRASSYSIHNSSSVGDASSSMPSSYRSWPESGGFLSWSVTLVLIPLCSAQDLSLLSSLLCCLSSLSIFWMSNIPLCDTLFLISLLVDFSLLVNGICF